MDFKKF